MPVVGHCACTTCHVIVKAGENNLSESEESEEDMLDKAPGLTPTSPAWLSGNYRRRGYYYPDP